MSGCWVPSLRCDILPALQGSGNITEKRAKRRAQLEKEAACRGIMSSRQGMAVVLLSSAPLSKTYRRLGLPLDALRRKQDGLVRLHRP